MNTSFVVESSRVRLTSKSANEEAEVIIDTIEHAPGVFNVTLTVRMRSGKSGWNEHKHTRGSVSAVRALLSAVREALKNYHYQEAQTLLEDLRSECERELAWTAAS